MGKRDIGTIGIKPSLGTAAVLDEIESLMTKDKLGRRVPRYAIVHNAIVAFRNALKKEADDDSSPTQ